MHVVPAPQLALRRRTRGERALLALAAFNALDAAAGGIGLLTGAIAVTDDTLDGTPFSSPTIPGLILLLAVGGSMAVATVALARRARWAALAAAGAGIVQMGWIVGQVAMLGYLELAPAVRVRARSGDDGARRQPSKRSSPSRRAPVGVSPIRRRDRGGRSVRRMDVRDEPRDAVRAQPPGHQHRRLAGEPLALVGRADDPGDLRLEPVGAAVRRRLHVADDAAVVAPAEDPVQPALRAVWRAPGDLARHTGAQLGAALVARRP